MRSPVQRSLSELRSAGWFCEVVEHWNPWSKKRKDLFGFGDILAIRGDEVLIVQTTTGSNMAARVAKILALESAKRWLASPHRKIVVHGWRKCGPRGKRKMWQCREQFIDFVPYFDELKKAI